MLRRSFRRGLLLGLLVGVVVAVVKLNRGRTPGQAGRSVAPPAPWPPIPDTEPVFQADVDTLLETPEAVEAVADVVEAESGPTPEPEPVAEEPPIPAPVVKAAKKAAKKKAPAKKAAARRKAALAPWVEPVEGVCPTTHPVKAKLSSRLFHLPGMFAYARTRPDRCYLDAEAATADGFTAAKR